MSNTLAKKFLASEIETREFADSFATILAPSDCILLEGNIGAGKSFFARAIIKKLCGADTDVPSPTFTLIQTYGAPLCDIWHCDLYRLSSSEEVLELGLLEAIETEICLIEWPDRMGLDRPSNALSLLFEVSGSGRNLILRGPSSWQSRLENIDV